MSKKGSEDVNNGLQKGLLQQWPWVTTVYSRRPYFLVSLKSTTISTACDNNDLQKNGRRHTPVYIHAWYRLQTETKDSERLAGEKRSCVMSLPLH